MILALQVLVTLILAVFLTACGVGGGPSQAIVQKAIALQFGQIQQNLGQQLYQTDTKLPNFVINHIKVNEQKTLIIQDFKSYQVQGTYDLTLEFPDHKVTQRQNIFEVYLQQPSEDEPWLLARPQTGEQWITSVIPGTEKEKENGNKEA
jgi:hypothetical protein